MKILLTLAFLLFNCATLFAQNDIEQEVRNYPDSRFDLISKARRFLLDEFKNGNMTKVKAIEEYLSHSLSNDTVIGILPDEQILIYYWTKDYGKLPLESIDSREVMYSGHRIRYYPSRYYDEEHIFLTLLDTTQKNFDTLIFQIKNSSLSLEEKDFLELNLLSVLFEHGRVILRDTNGIYTQEEINQLADTFLKQYPASKYEDYVRRNIRIVYRKPETTATSDVSVGTGIFNGQLANSFEPGFVFGLGLEYCYYDIGFFIRLVSVDSKPKKDGFMNNIFVKKGVDVRFVNMDIGASYSIFTNSYVKIAPSAGIGFSSISLTRNGDFETKEFNDATVGPNIIYSLGLNTDFKLVSAVFYPYYYLNLRLQYGYQILNFNSSGFSGGVNMFTVGIGIGQFTSEIEREY